VIFLFGQEEPLPPNHIYPEKQDIIYLYEWRTQKGDSLAWKDRIYKDSRWEKKITSNLFTKASHTWYRRNISISENIAPTQNISLYIPILLSAYEVYWDGQLVGRSGRISTHEDTFQAGRLSQYHIIPDSLVRPGIHTIAIRSIRGNAVGGGILYPARVGIHSTLLNHNKRTYSLAFFLAGIFFSTALFHLFVLTYRGRRATNGLFGMYSFSCAGYVIADSLIKYGGLSNNFFFPLAITEDFFWFGQLAFLPLFLLSHFRATYRMITGIIITVITALVVLLPRLAVYNIIPFNWVHFLDDFNVFYGYLSTAAAILITLGAALKKKEGSKTILSGLLIFFGAILFTGTRNLPHSWIVGVSSLNIFITIAIARQLSHQLQLSYRAKVKAARLELELLKKHIHPHFLLNSLNSIVAWIEEDPARATELVTELSRELRYLMAFAGEKRVILSEEIKLCRTHIAVMNMRREKDIRLICTGDFRYPVKIPPLILHTVIENGLSHGFRAQDEGTFFLDCQKRRDQFCITLSNNGSCQGTIKEEGTGSRYITRRLKEVFGAQWSFTSGPTAQGWKTEITLRGIR
ncbi:MAG: sensor histidine kinase, partial [Fibrobacterota bacterium]